MITTNFAFAHALQSLRTHLFAPALALCGLAFMASAAQADPLTFTLDSTQSYVTLNIPNFSLSGLAINTTGQNQTNGAPIGTAWSASTNTGNTAFVSGTIATDLNFGNNNVTGVQFISGSNTLAALVSGNYRPNPAAYNAVTSAYNNNGAAPQNYGVTAHTPLGNASLSSFANTVYDIGTPSKIPVGILSPPNTFPTDGYSASNWVQTGISNTIFSTQGLSLFLEGQVIPNFVTTLGAIGTTTPGSGLGMFTFTTATNLQMVVPVNVPFSIDLGSGIFLNGTETGQYVANAAVPEPSTLVMAGVGFVSIVTLLRRRRLLQNK
jgi:hypothetical protein